MKRAVITSGVMALGLSAAFMLAGAAGSTPPDGQGIYLASKCNSCHAVASKSIEKTNANSKAPDLSGTGLSHNAEWFKGWLLKTETLNGKKHVKKFTGPDDQLNTLAQWLTTLRRR